VSDAHDDRRIQYLLDEMSQLDRAIFEDEYFTSDDEDDLLQAAEDELIDSYARGTLSPERRARFEERYLASPEIRERVAFARWLMDTVAERQGLPRPRRPGAAIGPPAIGWAAGLAAAAVLAVSATFVTGKLRDAQSERDQLRDTVARLESHAWEQDRRMALLARDLGRVVSEAVAGGAVRSATATLTAAPGAADTPRIALAADVTVLRLDVPAPDAAASYRAVLRRDERELWHQDGLRALAGSHGAAVTCVIPAALLPAGRYAVVLTAEGTAGAHPPAREFQIERVRGTLSSP
jgi:hypothetical protein